NVGDEPLTVCLTIHDRKGSRETGRGAIALAASGDGVPRPREGTMLLVHIAVDDLRIRMTWAGFGAIQVLLRRDLRPVDVEAFDDHAFEAGDGGIPKEGVERRPHGEGAAGDAHHVRAAGERSHDARGRACNGGDVERERAAI